MSKIPSTITDKSISVVLDGRVRVLPKGHINFDRVERLLRNINTLESAAVNWRDVFRSRAAAISRAKNKLRKLVDIPQYVEKMTTGRIKVTDKGVLFNDQLINNAVTGQIMKLLKAGHDVGPLATFLDRLMSNPIAGVREDLYAWIESGDMALTPDGCFLAFKKVKADYSSAHLAPDGSKVYNNIGAIVSMPREEVDDNRDATCSHGLHFCSFQYLEKFGVGGESIVLILKVAPEDVVAIPVDYNRSKGRTWQYEVVGEVAEEECEHLFKDKPLVAGTLDDPLGDVANLFEDDEDDFDAWVSEDDEDEDYPVHEDPDINRYGRTWKQYAEEVSEHCSCVENPGEICRGCVGFEDWDGPTEDIIRAEEEARFSDDHWDDPRWVAENTEPPVDDLSEPAERLTQYREVVAKAEGRLIPVYYNGKIVRYEMVDD